MLIKSAPYAVGDSFVDLATADAYHALRKTVAWTAEADGDKRTAALVLATDYIAANYRLADSDTLNHVIPVATMALAPAMLSAEALVPTDNRAVIEDTVIGPEGMQATTKWVAIDGTPDPYPAITAILGPALVPSSLMTVLRLVR